MRSWQDVVAPGDDRPNPWAGTRFDASGRFLPEPGNTVVCQLAPESDSEAALLDLRAAMVARPEAGHFTFTTPESWHMTVFQGIIETGRHTDVWAKGLPLDAPVEAMTQAMAARLDGFVAPPAFAMRIAAVTPMGLSLTGATPADEAAARAWRDALSNALGIRAPDHDSYAFHLTMAYVTRWLPRTAMPGLAAWLDDRTRALQARLPVLHLERPAFCRFADMNAFPPLRPL